MLRTALTPRWLGLFALLVVVVVTCIQLGMWQLGVARDEARAEAVAEAADLPRVPLTEVVEPVSPFPATASSRKIAATGTYAADGQFLVVNRRLEGEAGRWVVTPLEVAATGATLPVVRGFLEPGEPAPEPPSGTVRVEGGLAPSESPVRGAPLPEGQMRSVDLSVLVNTWSPDIYNAFVFATGETTGAGEPVRAGAVDRVPPPAVPTGLDWRNAAYAVQWWIFAAFAVWMFVKMLRDDVRGERKAVRGHRQHALDH